MPRATCRYGFEGKVFAWAGGFSHTLTGHVHYPFLVIFGADGAARQVLVGESPERHDEAKWQAAREGAESWLVYDPFDGPVYTYIEWTNVDREVMERLLGAPFEPGDFASEGEPADFPSSWDVMF